MRSRGELSGSSSGASIEGLETFTLRIGADNIIQYVNTPLCRHFNLTKEDLIGHDMKVINGFMEVGFYEALQSARESSSSVREKIRTAEGETYEIRVTHHNARTDGVIKKMNDENHLRYHDK